MTRDTDITKKGSMSYKLLQDANNDPFASVRPLPISLYNVHAHADQDVSSSLAGTATPWGESMFDEGVATEELFQHLGDVRAENLPWFAKIGAGLAKGAVLAGTTFLDGTLGLLFGGGTAWAEDRWSGLWDNEFSKAMQNINQWAEEALPNYYTEAEQEGPWYNNIFTANFLGDKFIKNLGFTIGAFYSGGVTAAGLKATKLPQLIGAITKSSKAPAMINTAVGAVVSAVNEGRIEALNNSDDWFKYNKALLDDAYNLRLLELQEEFMATSGSQLINNGDGSYTDPAYMKFQQAVLKEKEAYNAALGKLSEDRLKMGNADLLMNIPILTASNIIQFGKLYANGFQTARRTSNIVGRAGLWSAGTTKLGTAASITKSSLSEGLEEISLKAASVISGDYYSTDVNNFYKSKTDPDAELETLSWTKSFAKGINETVNDASSWEEFFIGSLTGALGIPRFRGIRNDLGQLQSPITFELGALNLWRDYREKVAREQEIANYMNSRVNSPEFKNYYQGLIRHNKYLGDMNRAAEQNDEFSFKNAEHAQLVSDIAMFDAAGKMEDLNTLINAALDTSDEDLLSIVENTTSTLEDGSKVGPFVDKNGNPMYATEEGKQEMIKQLKENHDEVTNTINNYLKIKNGLDARTGQQLSDALLEELTWMKSQISNWENRSVGMSGEIKSAIGDIIGNLELFRRFNYQIRDSEGQHNTGITDRHTQADNNIKAVERAINILNQARTQNDKALVHILANNPKFTKGLISEINELDDSVLSTEEKESLTTKLNDISKIGNATKTYNAKLKEYLLNPLKLVEDHIKADEQAVQLEAERKSNDLRSSLSKALNLQEFESILNNEEDLENRETTLKSLEEEGNEMAKNYKETSQYNNEVRRVLNELGLDSLVTLDALTLLQNNYSNSQNLKQVANPNSVYINDESIFDEDSGGDVELSSSRFRKALYALLQAMLKVNNDNKFKDRFSSEYKESKDKFHNVEIVKNSDGSIDFYSLRGGRRVSGRNGFRTILSKDELKDNGLLEDIINIKVSKFRGINKNGEYIYDISFQFDSETRGKEIATIKINRSLHEVKGDDRDATTGDSKTSTTPPITSSKASSTTNVPIGNITAEMVAEENKKANDREDVSQKPNREKVSQFYRPAIPELHIEASKEGDFRPFDTVVSEREKGVDFSKIYSYLRDNGAFSYLNEGKLLAGDELGFMIDPEFNDHTIFIIDKRNNQVVGSLDESEYSISRYEGLKGLELRIRSEFANRSVSAKPFTTNYKYDNEMSAYNIHGKLDRVENGAAIYTDSKGQPSIILAATGDNTFIGIFREQGSNRWSIKMENSTKDKNFGKMISSVMAQLPIGAEIYERTSISLDGLRVFAQQLNHGFTIGNDTYETSLNGADLANTFNMSQSDRESMSSVLAEGRDINEIRQILKPYLEKFGAKNIEKIVFFGKNPNGDNVVRLKLPTLVKQRTEFLTSKTGKFIATPTTKVSKMMVGKIPYGSTERSLRDIPNVSTENRKPVFGIIKNGTLTTNGKISDNLIIKPVDMSLKEGRLYLLVPNGAGKYSPVAVRTKHFNSKEFNLEDSSVNSTPIGEDIKAAITKLTTASSQDDVSAVMRDLTQDLHMKDVMITWFDSSAGSGIIISKKVVKPDGTYEKVIINGKELIKEEKHDVYFSTSKKSAEIGGINFDATALELLGDTSALGTPKDSDTLYKEILELLLKFNLPLLVSTKRINDGAYNNRLINSNILTSNIIEASTKGTWFTTDYFDNLGKLHKAINPASIAPQPKRKIETPVGGNEGAIPGTRIVSAFSKKPYYVDLKTNTIRDEQGKSVQITNDNKILLDLAWAQDNFGNAANSSMMVDNKVVTPSGKVLNRTTQKYIEGKEALAVKDIITGRRKETAHRIAKAKEVIHKIYENQKRVDKTRTDGDYYYVLEDDGLYHQYSRVHSRLGSNWIVSDKLTEALTLIRTKLSLLVDNTTLYKNYLKYLENKYKISLDDYQEKTDAKSRDTIVNIVKDKMSGTNSQRALSAGSAVDSIIRQYFTLKDVSKIERPSNMSESAYVDLLTTLSNIKANMELTGERFLADNIVLYLKYSDGTRIAGEVDILSVDRDGNFKIYDVKTSRYSFYDFTDRYGHKVNYFNTPSATQRMSTRDYYTLLLSAYKNLFESLYNAPVTKLAVMPFVLSYNKDNISAILSEKGIPINYNPSVNVPLISGSRPTTTTTTLNKNVKPAPRPRPKSHKEVIFIFRINGMNSNNSDNVDWGASPNTDELRLYRKPNNGNTGSHWILFTNGNVLFGQFIPFKYGNIDTNQIRGGDAILIVFREVPTEDLRKQILLVALKYWNNIPQLQKIVMDILYPREPQTTSTKSTVLEALPIFKSSLEDLKPIEGITHDHRMGSVNESMGYFEIDGKLHKGYLTPLTTINGIKVYVTKIPNVTKGFGRATELAHVASNSFYAVFPNGKTFLFLKNNPVQEGMPQELVMESIKKGLEAKPQKVKELASEKTILFDPNAVPTIDTTKNLSPKEELMRALDIAVTLPKEGSVSYELNLRTATRIRNEILEGTKDDFPIDNAGNPKDLDWYLRSIRKNIEAYKQATAERLKASKEFAGIKSAEEDMRGVIAVQSAALRDLKQSLSHAFYLINNPIETPATINLNNTQTGAAYTAQRELAINNNDEEFEDEFTLKRVNDTESTIWNQEKELNWIAKVLPLLNKNDRIQIVKGLIRVGKQGILAWGLFDRGVITLSDIAAKGTTYHEAFHAVFNLLLDKNERFALYNEYRKNHPNMDNLSLEEEMAEDFREFVMNGGKDTRSLGRKIIDFFKSLFIKTKYWKNFRPSSIYYFRAINEGRYANKELGTTEISKQRTEEYTEEMQNILTNAPRDSKGKLLAPNGKVSNLTERQYAHVRTKAFKEWFGDWENTPQTSSKVVDENGEPLVVYHNTPTPFTVFDMDHTSRVSEQASEPFGHVGPKEAAGRIEGEQLALFLNLRNPIRTPDFEHETARDMLQELYRKSIISKEELSDLRGISNKELRQLMFDKGIDGTIYDNKVEKGGYSYSFISPNQIKSATDNIGTYSRTNDDIRYRVVDAINPTSNKNVKPNKFRDLSKEILESLVKKGWTAEKFDSISQEERDQAIRCIAF